MAELVTNLSMADVSVERRGAMLDDLVKSATRFLKTRYPETDGYDHKVRSFARFKDWSRLPGHRIWVRRGSLWGYRVVAVPADSQGLTVQVTLTRFVPLFETLAAIAAVPAMALLAGLLVYVLWKWGTWNDYRDPVLVLLLPPLALGLALFGILWGVARPFVARKSDPRQVAEETAILRQSLHDLIVAPV